MKPLPGTYALILRCETTEHVMIGRLGDLDVRPGYYVYVGSAFGPGGLAGRLNHHLRSGALRWHIDYLRRVAVIEEIWYAHDAVHHEHTWAQILAETPGAVLPLRRFGSSDCTCPAHLLYFASRPSFSAFRQAVALRTPGVQCSQCCTVARAKKSL